MIIARRNLEIKDLNGSKKVLISIFAPERIHPDWRCRFEIEWPAEKLERFAVGVDSVQALLFAMQMIGAQLYTSEYHEAGKLVWMQPGGGYGFPAPAGVNDLLIGDDARYGA